LTSTRKRVRMDAMTQIKVLASRVVSQIAAGEVVERPASVVKELVENALDAASTQISVEVQNGGISLIRVTDDGLGIADDQAETAFERHATSKIDSLDDLESLSTLGFRGEALPSIASVASVQMQTSTREDDSGTSLSLEDGGVVRHERLARSPGTTLTVSQLFRKVPARLKFLKSASAEASRIAAIVSQYALAYPEVRFNLTVDGRTVLRTPGSGKLIDSLVAIYGADVAVNMLELQDDGERWSGGNSAITVSGRVGSPAVARSTRDYISLFVNRRWVNSRTLSYAVEEAYHGLLMTGKHPIAVINITLPPNKVDVNVHPAKTEIKFQDERAVFAVVQKAVRQALVRSAPVPQLKETRSGFSPSGGAPAGAASAPVSAAAESALSLFHPADPPAQMPAGQTSFTPLISLPLLRVLGQLASNYIVAEGPDGLYLIDQHAAHERIMLEKLQDQSSAQRIEVQGLLEPATFEVDPHQAAALDSHLGELAEYGFNLEPFGDRTYLVRAVPALLGDRDWAAALREALEEQTTGKFGTDWREHLTITLACHCAIRAGQVLGEAEMRELVKQLERTRLPNSCPHGRPTIIHLTLPRIEKEFGRT
jgi:DNA mismatch repair protein MutL